MARIGNYLTDDNVTGSDKVLGTDTSGSTKNYELDSIANYFSKANSIAVAGQAIYQYKSELDGITHAEFTTNDGAGGNNILMSAISDIVIYKSVTGTDGDRSGVLRHILNDRFTIYGVSDANDYYDYEVTRIEDHPEVANAYKVTLVPIEGSATATFSREDYYAIKTVGGDKTYTHNQRSASASWVITHNLGKYPSVAVQDSAGTDVVGEVEYNTTQKLTITFSSAFSGTAYLN